jgi:hypothetical protein
MKQPGNGSGMGGQVHFRGPRQKMNLTPLFSLGGTIATMFPQKSATGTRPVAAELVAPVASPLLVPDHRPERRAADARGRS